MAKSNIFHGVGRRKTSVAKVYLYDTGTGKIKVNKEEFEKYFVRIRDRKNALKPLALTNNSKKFDVYISVKGGGTTGQCDAVKLAISRALLQYDMNLKPTLSKEGFLTRDSRKVERKKYGIRGARRRPQYTKR